MRLKLKRCIGTIWPEALNQRKVILLYHSVGNTPWGMPEKQFQNQIDWIADHCRVLSLPELVKTKSSQELQVALTFDDGYKTLYDIFAPIFARKKMNGMVYLNTGWIKEGEKDRNYSDASLGHYPGEMFLTWQEVKLLREKGSWDIGSHGVNHFNLRRIPLDLVKNELLQSKQDVEEKLNITCSHFSYPFGQYSKNVREVVKEVGYQYAAAVHHGGFNLESDYLAMPRINISREYSLKDFGNIIRGKWDFIGLIHRLRRQ